MARDMDILEAVESARELLRGIGYECTTTVDDLILWFQADTPYDEGFGLDHLIKSPLLVAHELVEIERVKAMGLRLTKDVIVENMERVDDAYLEATEVEMELAVAIGAIEHVEARMRDLAMRLEDPAVTEENKGRYRELRDRTVRAVRSRRNRH